MNTFFTRLACISLLLISSPTYAIIISLNPTTQTATAGTSLDLALVISGLGSGAAPSIGTFDLNVGFNSSILGFSSAVFGDPSLGDQLDLFGLGSLSIATLGAESVNLFELSFDAATDLNALQADSFTLATLSFNALSVGTSPLVITLNALGNANGDSITTDLVDGSISVNASDVHRSVPEPAIWLLLGLGALTMNTFTRRAPKSIS